MSITTIYKCDRCGAEASTNEHMYIVEVRFSSVAQQYRFSAEMQVAKKIDCCKPCAQALALVKMPERPKGADPAPAELTFEELVREIIREEVAVAINP
jgi:hypothetical protein